MTSESGSSSTARFSSVSSRSVLTDVRQRIIAEPLMRGRVVRIQLQSPFVLADRAGIIESVESLERGQSSMGTGRRVIQCERFLRRSLGLAENNLSARLH